MCRCISVCMCKNTCVCVCGCSCTDQLLVLQNVIFQKIGEDWIFLTLLGILMAFLSFAMDFVIEKCQEGNKMHVCFVMSRLT